MDLNQELNQSVTGGRREKGNTICHVHIYGRDIIQSNLSIKANNGPSQSGLYIEVNYIGIFTFGPFLSDQYRQVFAIQRWPLRQV